WSWVVVALTGCAVLAFGGMAVAERQHRADVAAKDAVGASAPAGDASRSPSATSGAAASARPKAAASDSASDAPSPSASSSATSSPSPSAPMTDPGVSHTVPASQLPPQVGAVFDSDGLGGVHHCTASVVDSPGKDLIVTAAHCLGTTSDLFVPGYHDGQAPYGIWHIQRIVTDSQWNADSDPDHDVAFAVVEPLNGKTVESVVGSYTLGTDQGTSDAVTVIGYPEVSDEAIACTDTVAAYSSTQLRIYCTGYSGGTSGSPWLVGPGSGDGSGGTVMGVIGGYEQGGDTDDVSYSVAFGSTVQSLYEQAVSDAAD
ncbi:trypsin-like serine protease, partial [Streptomyces sp. PTM05]